MTFAVLGSDWFGIKEEMFFYNLIDLQRFVLVIQMKSLLIRENLVKSADRAIDIIEFVARKAGGCTHTEIATALDIPGSSANALLNTLTCKECLVYDPAARLYCLGPKILFLAGLYLEDMDLIAVGRPFIKSLYERTDESVALVIAVGHEIQFVDRLNSSQPVIRPLMVGARSPIYATAAGKAMLAFWKDPEIEEYLASTNLEKIGPGTVTDPGEIRRELEAVRRGEASACLEGLKDGVTAFARPILSARGAAAAAVAVAIPTYRLTPEKKETVLEALREEAWHFSERLGHPQIRKARAAGN